MSTLELELERLRASLRAATAADLRRRSRRRRLVARLAVVPALALVGGGVAVAVDPPWGEPAPPAVQQTFDQSVPKLGGAHGSRLTVWARDGEQVLYGSSASDGRWCVSIVDPMSDAINCRQVAERPKPGEITMLAVGGATARAGNAAAGEVSAPTAETVSITVPGEDEPTVVRVGHNGFFIAQLPDSTLREPGRGEGARPAELTVVARDGAGDIVARTPAGG
jgi:hypothetical protein